MTEEESYRFCKIMYFTVPSIQCCKFYIFIYLPKFLAWLYHVLSLYYPGGYLRREKILLLLLPPLLGRYELIFGNAPNTFKI